MSHLIRLNFVTKRYAARNHQTWPPCDCRFSADLAEAAREQALTEVSAARQAAADATHRAEQAREETGCRGFWNGIRRWRAFPQFIALFGLDEWGVNCLHSSGR
jgi:hypothetical protein